MILGLPALAHQHDLVARCGARPRRQGRRASRRRRRRAPNPLQLDPPLSYAVCRVNLCRAGGHQRHAARCVLVARHIRPPAPSIYSTTNRDGIGQNLNLGIFNADQTHLLAEQQIDVADGLLIVELNDNEVFVVVTARAAPRRPCEALSKQRCRRSSAATSRPSPESQLRRQLPARRIRISVREPRWNNRLRRADLQRAGAGARPAEVAALGRLDLRPSSSAKIGIDTPRLGMGVSTSR